MQRERAGLINRARQRLRSSRATQYIDWLQRHLGRGEVGGVGVFVCVERVSFVLDVVVCLRSLT